MGRRARGWKMTIPKPLASIDQVQRAVSARVEAERNERSKLAKFKKIRNTILTYLDGTGWEWSQPLSILLDQIDSELRRLCEHN